MDVFNIKIEFEPTTFRYIVEQHIRDKKKGYVCVVDANVITIAQKKKDYQAIVRNSTVNTCDGSSIATMVNRIYDTDYHAYNGPELFEYYIERPYKHLLLGNTVKKVEQIKNLVKSKGLDLDLTHLDVPFIPVEQFDFEGIAKQINEIQPDIIWVSLGAPKQEIFMSKTFPHINSGVMFGIGAAFNFYTGDLHNRKQEIGGLRFIWLERLFNEPQKQWSRVFGFLKVIPKMYSEEKKRAKLLRSRNS